jgi:DNA-binding transcriptional LysR family regulator
MELRVLEYFTAIADGESFTRAAERLHVAQPSVSQQIRALERELGEPLFERGARGATLTPGGRALLPYARAALAAVAAARAEFAARSGLLTGSLALGTVGGLEETVFPELLGIFHRRYPGVAVRLTEGTSAPLLDQVARGELDAAIIAGPGSPLPDGISDQVFLRDMIMAVTRSDSKYAQHAAVPLRLVSSQPLITYSQGSGLRDLIEAAFQRAGLMLTAAYESNDPALHVALARQGVGTALAAGSDPSLRNASDITCLPLDPPIPYDKRLIWRTAETPPAPVRALLEIWHEPSGPAANQIASSQQASGEGCPHVPALPRPLLAAAKAPFRDSAQFRHSGLRLVRKFWEHRPKTHSSSSRTHSKPPKV